MLVVMDLDERAYKAVYKVYAMADERGLQDSDNNNLTDIICQAIYRAVPLEDSFLNDCISREHIYNIIDNWDGHGSFKDCIKDLDSAMDVLEAEVKKNADSD